MQTLSIPAKTQLPQLTHARNPGMALDLDWVAGVQANTSAIERRAATIAAGGPLKRTFRRRGC